MSRLETVFSYVLVALILLSAVLFIGDEIADHIKSFQAWIDGLGPWAYLVYIMICAVLSSVFVPDSLIGIVTGATFGFTQAVTIVVCSNLLGAVLQFALARKWLKPVVDRKLSSRPDLAAMQKAVLKQELRLQFLIRLTPLNRAITGYVLAAAGVRFATFVVACLALLPHLCLEVYFGYAGKHLAKVAGTPAHTLVLHDVVLIVGLVVAIVVIILLARMARKAVEEASAAEQHLKSEF